MNEVKKEVKTQLAAEVCLERHRWEIDGKLVDSIQINAVIEGEVFRFRVVDKDSRLLSYIMKTKGYALLDSNGEIVKEG